MSHRSKLMWRWSLVTAGLIALFWGLWYLVAGSMPSMTGIGIIKLAKYRIPLQPQFSLSHWWDILLGPIYSGACIYIFTNKKIQDYLDNPFGMALFVGFAVGFLIGAIIVFVTELITGLIIGLIGGLILSLISVLVVVVASGLIVLIGKISELYVIKKFINWLSVKKDEDI